MFRFIAQTCALVLMVGLEGQQETGATQLAAVPKGNIVFLGQEFHDDLEWWKWALREPQLVDGVFFIFNCFFTARNGIRNVLSDATLSAVEVFAQRREYGGDMI